MRPVTVVVAKSSNAALNAVTVNGLPVVSGSVVLPARTGSAVIKAVASDPEALVVSAGGSVLACGDCLIDVMLVCWLFGWWRELHSVRCDVCDPLL